MLGAHSNSDQPSWNPSQEGPIPQNLQLPGKLGFAGAGQYTANNAILNRNLEALREPGGKFAALLNFSQMICRKRIFAQRFRENIGGCDSILDC